jgi:hypothetical protein
VSPRLADTHQPSLAPSRLPPVRPPSRRLRLLAARAVAVEVPPRRRRSPTRVSPRTSPPGETPCLVDSDCKACDGCDKYFHTCDPNRCHNGVKDGSETDVDWGGPVCDAAGLTCTVGGARQTDADCTSGGCDPKTHVRAANQCGDGIKSGKETDAGAGVRDRGDWREDQRRRCCWRWGPDENTDVRRGWMRNGGRDRRERAHRHRHRQPRGRGRGRRPRAHDGGWADGRRLHLRGNDPRRQGGNGRIQLKSPNITGTTKPGYGT